MKRLRLSDQEDLESKYFRKIFQFQNAGNWSLPQRRPYTAQKFEVPELQDLKHQLNRVKGKLSQFDLAKWSTHTKNRDVAGFVMGTLRKKVKPELLTQAWCKFYEIVSTFPLVQSDGDGVFTSVHLCEAPGAFICALNHYLVINYPNIKWKWSANTLNPDYEGNTSSDMISDDRLICYTRNKWEFGSDLTGDIQKYYNHCDLANKVNMKEKVSLVTADGSRNCMSDPGEQEKLVEFLQYCETMTALTILKKGGAMVLKIFTIFEESTICLIYLLNCIFDQVSVFKPCTSKSGNSEIYVICNGFHGYSVLSSSWEPLIEPYKHGCFEENVSMFSIDDIPYSFRIQLISCCSDFFLERQINVIEENIYQFLYPDHARIGSLHKLKIDIANFYVTKYKLKPILHDCKIVPYLNVHDQTNNVDIDVYQQPNTIRKYSFKEYSFDKYLDITYGKRMDIVNTSRFASKESLHNLKEHCKKDQPKDSLYALVLENINKTTAVINGRHFDLEPHYKYQKDLFSDLLDALDQKKHIILLDVPFHTHFLAALWCIVASAFDSVHCGALNGTGLIIFYKPLELGLPLVKNILHSIQNAYNNVSENVFPLDIVHIFRPDVFITSLDFVPNILNECNKCYLPP